MNTRKSINLNRFICLFLWVQDDQQIISETILHWLLLFPNPPNLHFSPRKFNTILLGTVTDFHPLLVCISYFITQDSEHDFLIFPFLYVTNMYFCMPHTCILVCDSCMCLYLTYMYSCTVYTCIHARDIHLFIYVTYMYSRIWLTVNPLTLPPFFKTFYFH